MSSSKAVQVANAINDLVKVVSGAETSAVDLVPEWTLENITSKIRITVSPQSETDGNRSTATRGGTSSEVITNIAIAQKLLNKTKIDEKILFVEQIKDALQRQSLSGIGVNVLANIDPIYDANVFKRMRVFISVISITTKILVK